jgi:hypothetical protein
LRHLTAAAASTASTASPAAPASASATTAAACIGVRHCQRERGTGGDQAQS